MATSRLSSSKQNHFIQQVERAIFDLRRGLPVIVRSADGICLVAPIEGISTALFDEMQGGARGPTHLILTRHRLAHLGLEQPPEAAAVAIQPEDTRADATRWAADPTAQWPASHPISPVTQAEQAALALIRRGLLIPAAISIVPNDRLARTLKAKMEGNELLAVDTTEVFSHCQAAPWLQRIGEAEVPLEATTKSRVVVFREATVIRKHLAVLIGAKAHWPEAIPVRLHSACLTGDLFGSQRCDCGSQLKASVAEIRQYGGGVLLYLDQEGRGTGLVNKMRAYQIQDDGLDTVDADRALGFGQDEREYTVAREMLIQLGVTHINLLTNNPAKLEAMNHEPIQVVNRSSIYGRLTKENRCYLATKARRAGHWLDDLLSGPLDPEDNEASGSK